ncbi:methyltransferase family protein [Dyella mobilis]|uniref:Isoprenylcysteine carboxylmethyltransferase family protein n=1 Tax=Dyella mobilis TaxID=1849582 RepID=A0ABS2KEJ5_9GAMM|nr:isoprenylcysteine carboxylmethyltransferase family protein [Dyella mobilis]MBM7129328.1 isoprenylcysteine carboxylmethyltransferase family protein [Dyella mobilis]GLQ98622.1 protein-S-isoprenylcysteine methyltransferase [Dyella mobilis]
MTMSFGYLFTLVWLVWLAYWGISAIGVKAAVRVESNVSRFGKYALPLMVAVLLFWNRQWLQGTFLVERFVPDRLWIVWLGFLLTVAGLAFTCWARVTLGRNWSGVVQLKQDHELIVRGPYNIVRHPIYSGLLLAFLGSALALGEWRGPIAMLIVGISFWRKLRLEERWLCELFGEQYRSYMLRVKALVPWLL